MKRILKKVSVIAISAALAITFIPWQAFADETPALQSGMATKATNIKTGKDSSGKEYYTQMTLEPYTFYDVAGGSKKSVDDTMIAKLVQEQLADDWLEIANGCFISAGETASDAENAKQFKSYYNNAGSKYDYNGDIRQYLKGTAKDKGSKSHESFVSTGGFHITNSLEAVREAMAQQVAGQIDHKSMDANDVLKYGGPDKDGILKEFKDDQTENNTVVYSICTSIFPQNVIRTYFRYNSFGIAFYDFHPCAIQAEGLKNKSALDGCDPDKIRKGEQVPGVQYTSTPNNHTGADLTNESDKPSEGSVGRTDGWASSYENNFMESSTKTYGTTINHTFKWGSDTAPWGKILGSMETSLGFSFEDSYTISKGSSHSETTNKEVTVQQGVTMDPNTYISVRQNDVDEVLTSDYDTPVMISYKVAIFSIWGDVYADNALICSFSTAGYQQGNYMNIIGSSDKLPVFGVSANENLHLRAVDNQTSHRNDADSGAPIRQYYIKHGSRNYNRTDLGVDWNGGFMSSDATTKAAVTNQSTKIPMLSCGCSYAVTYQLCNSTINPVVPLYLPKQFVLKTGKGSYEIRTGDTMDLDKNLELECWNKNNVPYVSFAPQDGGWVVCDKSGKPVDNPAFSIAPDATGDQILTAAAAGDGYITWKMDPKIEYTAKLDEGTITYKNNLPAPIIPISVTAEPFVGSITITGDFDGCVGDKGMNLNSKLTASVYDNIGKKVGRPVLWQAQELPEDGIVVSQNGDITLTKPGQFHVQAYVSNAGTGSDDVRSTWYEITAKPARQLSTISFRPLGESEIPLMNKPHTSVYKFDLETYLKGFDQYGDPWTGSFDTVKFDIPDSSPSAYLDEENMLCIVEEGDYQVTAQLSTEFSSSESTWKVSMKSTMDNPMKAKGNKVRVKFSKLKKKAQTIKRSKALSVTGAEGDVTYAPAGVTKAKFAKYFTVDPATGNIQVGKGLKRGKYKVRVTVTAAGNETYAKAEKTVTVKVRVK